MPSRWQSVGNFRKIIAEWQAILPNKTVHISLVLYWSLLVHSIKWLLKKKKYKIMQPGWSTPRCPWWIDDHLSPAKILPHLLKSYQHSSIQITWFNLNKKHIHTLLCQTMWHLASEQLKKKQGSSIPQHIIYIWLSYSELNQQNLKAVCQGLRQVQAM